MLTKIGSLLALDKISKDTDLLNLPIKSIKDSKESDIHILQELGYTKISDLLEIEDPQEIISKNKDLTYFTLEKLVTVARIINDFINDKKALKKKLVLIGLDNAGKTSMIDVLLNPDKTVTENKPTLGLKRENLDFLDYNLVLWDFGGQRKYRDQYLLDKEKNFAFTDVLFYVIDFAAPKRFQESLDYLEAIIKIYKYLEETPFTIICFHKCDLIKSDKELNKRKSKLMGEIDKIIGDFPTTNFITSIFEKNSIFQAFSTALRKLSSVNNIIQNILNDFSEKINCGYIGFYNETGICVAEVGDIDDKQLAKNFAFNVILGEELNIFPDKATKLLLFLANKNWCILERLDEDAKKYFLVYIISELPQFISKESLLNEMKPWLINFF
jgi:ADP-ribosylation factor-like protein 2